ncbi:MAG: hypothetical protein ACTSRH_04450 [Promethearchaeota archaeon]
MPKFEIELNKKLKDEIQIISKAFDVSSENFIRIALENEIHFIKSTLEYNNAKDLEDYYKRKINVDELLKLILMEVV